MDLKTIHENSLFNLRKILTSLDKPGESTINGKAHGAIALLYHRIALCEMLRVGRADRFQIYLCKSALVRLHLLQLVSQGLFPHPSTICASQNFSFIDALVAGQLELATELARKTTDTHEPTVEYEDDFLLHRFLQKFFLYLHARESLDFSILFDHWERVLEGGTSAYMAICAALLKREARGFEEALRQVIDERVQRFRHRERYPEESLRTDGALFMTGLALVRLAEMSGLPTRREYPNIPRLARLPPSRLSLSPTSWMRPDEALPP